jgi:hypothetical protein
MCRQKHKLLKQQGEMVMERTQKGNSNKEEELFQLWDEMRGKGIRNPGLAIRAAKEELGIEERVAAIYMQRYVKCFRDPL